MRRKLIANVGEVTLLQKEKVPVFGDIAVRRPGGVVFFLSLRLNISGIKTRSQAVRFALSTHSRFASIKRR
jgi:hypothetical protein